MKPFHEGQRAFKNPRFYKGKTGALLLEPNPYKENTKDHRDYEYGFQTAYYDNLGEGSQGVSQKEKTNIQT
jgi:hypothetical protein